VIEIDNIFLYVYWHRENKFIKKKALVKVKNDYKYILSSLNMRIPKKQRALVLGGGGALGANETGVIKTLDLLCFVA
jgi:cobalamin biosynthesis Co2+ chelatase CbiK